MILRDPFLSQELSGGASDADGDSDRYMHQGELPPKEGPLSGQGETAIVLLHLCCLRVDLTGQIADT